MDETKVTTILPDQSVLDNFLNLIEYKAASSREELEGAYSLVYREYLRRGYVKESGTGLKFSIYNALPDTTTFVAVVDNKVISTATLIPDSPLGLPMDEIYHRELESFRRNKKKLCEISMLASDTELFVNGISLMLNSKKMFLIFYLFKTVFDYAIRVLKLDYICITINPKHALTYDFLLFKDLGGLKRYNNANGAPAIGKYLDLNSVENECREKKKEGLYRMFFLKKIPPEKYNCKIKLSEEDLRYFFIEKSDIFKNASPAQMEYIKSCYPSYNLI